MVFIQSVYKVFSVFHQYYLKTFHIYSIYDDTIFLSHTSIHNVRAEEKEEGVPVALYCKNYRYLYSC